MIKRALTAEFIGTAFLLAAVVGSGIMAERLSTDAGLQLLQNALATGFVLTALILTFQSASGAHFNPAVTLVARVLGEIDTRMMLGYFTMQVLGGITGVMAANIMFELPAIELSTTDRTGFHLAFAEGVATLGLLLVIFGTVRGGKASLVAFAVGGYIAGAYYFTSSTSFANPAVTIARAFSDTFAGIAPSSIVPFLAAQIVGAGVAVVLILLIYPRDAVT